jgi:alpha-L-rhamnosidase
MNTFFKKNQFFAWFLLLSFFPKTGSCQDVYAPWRQQWLKLADELQPALTETTETPERMVNIITDQNVFQGWKTVPAGSLTDLYATSFKTPKTVTLDFGKHITGYFSFNVATLKGTPDAPLKFKLTFGEVPSEIETPYDPYKGDLSRAWLQDEYITVMDIPSLVSISRRMAFRYVKIELLGSSQYFDFKIENPQCRAVSSVKTKPSALQANAHDMIKKIDSVGLNTLKECMQTVYEDGPKRDRRLWIGDLYLESLANSYSFKNHDLTKRCLYLLAGLSDKNGYLVGTVFETPEPHPQAGQHLLDYSFLYNVTLKEYLTATNDYQTANSLWPVAKVQAEIAKSYILPNGLMDFEKAKKEWWLFFDWKEELDKSTALQGLTIYTLKQTYELAKLLKKEHELKELPELIRKMSQAARTNLYDSKLGLFTSGSKKQVSYASQIWMVLANVASPAEAKLALKNITSHKEAVIPGAPYLYHFFISALIESGLKTEAKEALINYWGGMVKKGADTFWEVYDPNDAYLSPYHFFPINSYCHAWSCTPVYFIRKYTDIFQ